MDGYSRTGYFFTDEPTPGTPAANVPSFGGGSTASNPATQLGLAVANNGRNLKVARNIFTYTDQVTLTRDKHQGNAGVSFDSQGHSDPRATAAPIPRRTFQHTESREPQHTELDSGNAFEDHSCA